MKTKYCSKAFLISIILMIVSFSSHAKSVHNTVGCHEYYKMQNWTNAKKTCLEAAANGTADSRVYFALAKMTDKGLLHYPNQSQSQIWLQKAAEHGHVDAQYELAGLYRDQGKDFDSYYWYKQATKNGHQDAAKVLAYYYLNGTGTSKDYPQAIALLELSAYEDDLGSQLKLASLYEDGYGTGKNLPRALYWYEKAASLQHIQAIEKSIEISDKLYYPEKSFKWRKKLSQHSPNGMYLLAKAYEDGYGTTQNKTKAFHWYRQAARHDHIESQWITATLYHDGIGTEQDMSKAIYWYKRSANNGVGASLYQLAMFHLEGHHLPQDTQKAEQYMAQAAQRGHAKAKVYIARKSIKGMSISQKNHAGQLFKEAALAGDKDGQYEYGRMLYTGFVFTKDTEKGVHWLRQAGNQNQPQATALLAKIYYSDKDYHDKEQALEWLNRASMLGDPVSQYTLGELHTEGLWLKKDWHQAFKYYQKSAQNQYVKAQGALGRSYHEGIGVPQNYHLAVKWYEKAAFQGDLRSQYNLAILYKKGLGTQRDKVRAYSWMSIAAASGFPEAMVAQKQWRKQLNRRELTKAQHMSANMVDATPVEYEWAAK